ncbi:hypothetical protein BJF78_15570 [Pseudonocardia sp. CNS-139]|nr:hypothetical protein BJF78_15570 [Pseudonocardia sp. CNS-139]
MRRPALSAALLGILFGLTGMSTSAVTVALPEMAADLDISAATAAWMVSGYTVALAVATPTHGRLADMVGIRLPLVLGVGAMALGALAAALAPSFAVLMVARVVQGVGAAAVPVLATALIAARWRPEDQPGALGRVAGMAATLGAFGPLLGGALESLGGWRWALAIPVLGALAIPALRRVAPGGGTGEPIDRSGAVLVAVAASGLVLLLQSRPRGRSRPSSGPCCSASAARCSRCACGPGPTGSCPARSSPTRRCCAARSRRPPCRRAGSRCCSACRSPPRPGAGHRSRSARSCSRRRWSGWCRRRSPAR